MALINYVRNHPNVGYRKVAEEFQIERTQTCAITILQDKESIIASYESNVGQSQQKKNLHRKVLRCIRSRAVGLVYDV